MYQLARLLRERGVTVARDIIKRELTGSLAYARAAAIRSAIVLGLADQPAGTVLVYDVPTGTRRPLSLDVFERAVAQGDAPWIT
jgi:histidyl-tRNA synthetase